MAVSARENLKLQMDEYQVMFDTLNSSFAQQVQEGAFLNADPLASAARTLEAAKNVLAALNYFKGSDQELAKHYLAQTIHGHYVLDASRVYAQAAYILLG